MKQLEERGIYKRNEGRWEARYKKGIDEKGRAVYASVYAKTREEAIEKRKIKIGLMSPEEASLNQMNLLILGAGMHGKDVYEVAYSLHIFRKISFLDDNAVGDNIIGKCTEALKFKREYPCAFVAIGDNKKRKKYAEILKNCGFLMPSIVSPAASISSKAVIGEGVSILPQVTISEATIGDFCILSSNSLVNGGAEVGAFSHLGCGGIVLKNRKVPQETKIKDGEIF
ncbi:MAG: hypothetical protein K6G45_06090 [Lachnospiraceae bacterium]|nr:hypothetical protein [Lachnospiraceae bacterium]